MRIISVGALRLAHTSCCSTLPNIGSDADDETRALSVAGPTVWNSLPDQLRDSAVDSEQFTRELKTNLFAGHSKR